MQYNAIQYNVIRYNAMQCNTLQYFTKRLKWFIEKSISYQLVRRFQRHLPFWLSYQLQIRMGI